MSWPIQPDPDFDKNGDYNLWIDDQSEPIQILTAQFQPSKVLFTMEPQTYQIAYADYLQEQKEGFKQTIITQFPRLVALNYYRFENSYEHNVQRLHFLRDTWEALINLLHALVVSEFRFNHFPIPKKGKDKNGNDISADLFSDKVNEKLLTIERCLQYTLDNKLNLACISIIPILTIQQMRELNQVRNAFSHVGALSEVQAEQFIAETVDDVLALLHDLKRLQNIRLIRYLGQGKSITEVRHERYDGYAIVRDIKTMPIDPNILPNVAGFLRDDHILATDGHWIVSLRPFIHFQPDPSGHFVDLCFLKKKGHGDPEAVYVYEVNGKSQEVEFLRSFFAVETAELMALI